MDDHIMEMIDNKPIGLFNFKSDLFLENNLIGTNPELQLKMEEKLKAVIQTYNRRVIENDMFVRK
jgi:hypothetical protein